MSIEANSMSEEKIMAALEAGDFAVSYIAPSCVEERKHIDGSSYYIVSAFSGSCFNGDRGGVRLTVCGVGRGRVSSATSRILAFEREGRMNWIQNCD